MFLFFCHEKEALWVRTKPCFLKMVCGNIPLKDLEDTEKTELHMCIPLPKKKLNNLRVFDTMNCNQNKEKHA